MHDVVSYSRRTLLAATQDFQVVASSSQAAQGWLQQQGFIRCDRAVSGWLHAAPCERRLASGTLLTARQHTAAA